MSVDLGRARRIAAPVTSFACEAIVSPCTLMSGPRARRRLFLPAGLSVVTPLPASIALRGACDDVLRAGKDARDQLLDLFPAHEIGFEVLLLGLGEIFGSFITASNALRSTATRSGGVPGGATIG